MKTKKIIALALTAVLALSAVGCKKKEAVSLQKDENGDYIFENRLDLTVWETQGTDYSPEPLADNDIVAKWLLDKTKVNIKNVYGNDGGQWDAKRTKLIAGGNLPDMVHCGDGQGVAHFNKLDEYGVVYHITDDMLKTYAPNLWNQIPDEIWDQFRNKDGEIIGIPYRFTSKTDIWDNVAPEDKEFIISLETAPNDVMNGKTRCLYVRDDILRKVYPEAKTWDNIVKIIEETNAPVGDDMLDIPIYSTDEFIEFMYKIKKMNLKEGGKTVYAYGYSGDDCWNPFTFLGADMYGYKNHHYISTWSDTEQKMIVPLTRDIIKETARTQNKMVNDGVISPESLANSSTQYNENVSQGLYAIAGSLPGGILAFNEELEKQGKSYRYRPFITQVPAAEGYPAFDTVTKWFGAYCFINTAMTEEEIIQTLNWMNVQFSDEFLQIKHWGTEDMGLYVDTEKGRRFKDKKWEDYFVYEDSSALGKDELMGIGGEGSLMGVSPCGIDQWTPQVTYKAVTYVPKVGSGLSFSADSPHAQNIKEFPPVDVWDANYANIPEVVTYWAERGQWESKFKKALAVPAADFEKTWQEAIDNLNSIVDIHAMEDAMTEIARTLLP